MLASSNLQDHLPAWLVTFWSAAARSSSIVTCV
jgi:hypothetical protein